MQKKVFNYLLFLLILGFASCAKRGTVTGGLKDTLAPILKSSLPKNGAVNFNGNEIRLNFDEYVKLKNIGKQLVISPPMKEQPEILPYNASKFITIKLKEPLQENTTYSFNFGQSIEDNNEGNPMQQFKYIFSTGNTIDSLALNVKIKDAIEKKTPSFVSIMLYEANEKYNDSTIYKNAPRYIGNSLDSLKIIKIENLKQGKYRLIAIKDENKNNKFDPKTEKIAFQKDFISIPNDTIYELELFKQKTDFKVLKPIQLSGNKMVLGYEGNPKDVKIDVKKGSETIPFKVTSFPKKDSLQIWFKAMKNDSLTVSVTKEKIKESFSLKIKDQKKDTLSFSVESRGDLGFRDKIIINSSLPLTEFDKSKIKILNKDSNAITFQTEYDEEKQQYKIDFTKQPLEKYYLTALPGAFTDFYARKSDTLKYDFSTRNSTDYGNLKVVLENIKRFPIIVELTDREGKVLYTEYSEKENIINFDLIEPNKYTLRIIYDDNRDKEWNAGNFLDKKQSEEVIYLPKEIDLRANWDWEQPMNCGKS